MTNQRTVVLPLSLVANQRQASMHAALTQTPRALNNICILISFAPSLDFLQELTGFIKCDV